MSFKEWASVGVSFVLAISGSILGFPHNTVGKTTMGGGESVTDGKGFSEILISISDEEGEKKYNSAKFSQEGRVSYTIINYTYDSDYIQEDEWARSHKINEYGTSETFNLEPYTRVRYLRFKDVITFTMDRQMEYYLTEDSSYYDVSAVITTKTQRIEYPSDSGHSYNDWHYYIESEGVYYCDREYDDHYGNVVTPISDTTEIETRTLDAEIYMAEDLFAEKINTYTIYTESYEGEELKDMDLKDMTLELKEVGEGWLGTAMTDSEAENSYASVIATVFNTVNQSNYSVLSMIGSYMAQESLFNQAGGLYLLKNAALSNFVFDLKSIAGLPADREDIVTTEGTFFYSLVDKTCPELNLIVSENIVDDKYEPPKDKNGNYYYDSGALSFYKGNYEVEYSEMQNIRISNINKTKIKKLKKENVTLFEDVYGGQ